MIGGDNMTNEKRAEEIKKLMKDRKMTALDLSGESGIHRNTIANALNGKGITVKTLTGIAKGLGISPTLLV